MNRMQIKIIILAGLLVYPGITGFSQYPGFYYFEPDEITVKTIYNAKNEITGRLEYRMLKSTGTDSVLGETIRIKDGKETDKTIGLFSFDGKTLLISMGKTKEGKEALVDYPLNMRPGQRIITDIEFDTETKFAGKNLKATCKISNRRIMKTNVLLTTGVGSWNCVKMGYDMRIISKVIGFDVPVDVSVVEWFSDRGIIRTDVFRNGKLHESRQLTGFKTVKLN